VEYEHEWSCFQYADCSGISGERQYGEERRCEDGFGDLGDAGGGCCNGDIVLSCITEPSFLVISNTRFDSQGVMLNHNMEDFAYRLRFMNPHDDEWGQG
jgi:hypothetical protein